MYSTAGKNISKNIFTILKCPMAQTPTSKYYLSSISINTVGSKFHFHHTALHYTPHLKHINFTMFI
jgi:hypothetical protein